LQSHQRSGKSRAERDRTAEARDHCAFAGHRQSGGRVLRGQDHPLQWRLGEDASDAEIVDGITLLAETEGIFTETAGGVTVASARKLYAQGRINPDETTVLCITGNGLKTTDALAGRFETAEPIPPKLAAFEKFLESEFATTGVVERDGIE